MVMCTVNFCYKFKTLDTTVFVGLVHFKQQVGGSTYDFRINSSHAVSRYPIPMIQIMNFESVTMGVAQTRTKFHNWFLLLVEGPSLDQIWMPAPSAPLLQGYRNS